MQTKNHNQPYHMREFISLLLQPSFVLKDYFLLFHKCLASCDPKTRCSGGTRVYQTSQCLCPSSLIGYQPDNLEWRVCVCACSTAKSCLTFLTPWTVASKLPCAWYFPGRITGVGCHFLFQGILPTQGLNPCLLWLLH